MEQKCGGEYRVFYREQYLSGCCLSCLATAQLACPRCGLLSYCSRAHLDSDSDRHEEICEALRDVADRLGVENVFHKAYLLGGEAYREFRSGLMEMCCGFLGRPLHTWEQEFCLFPPACATCHRLSEDLETCPECGLTRWCAPGHKPRRHEQVCRALKLYVLLARERPRLVHMPELACPPVCSADLPARNPPDGALLSEIATCPLTILHCLRAVGLSEDNLVVHVVGPEPQFEMSNLRKWDDFLFRFLDSSLSLVFVGPEAGRLPTRRIRSQDGRVLQFFFDDCLYHEYQGLKPSLVCLFNPGLYRTTGFDGKDSWRQTIEALFSGGVPVLVTAYTGKEARADLRRVKTLVPKVVEHTAPGPNPFASSRPLMNFVSDQATPVVFKNAFYMVLTQES